MSPPKLCWLFPGHVLVFLDHRMCWKCYVNTPTVISREINYLMWLIWNSTNWFHKSQKALRHADHITRCAAGNKSHATRSWTWLTVKVRDQGAALVSALQPTVFPSQFKFNGNFHSHLDSNTAIATKFSTWHNSCAVVAWAKICCNLIASNGIMARRSFHRIWIAGKKTLVKWPPGQHEHKWASNSQLSKYKSASWLAMHCA